MAHPHTEIFSWPTDMKQRFQPILLAKPQSSHNAVWERISQILGDAISDSHQSPITLAGPNTKDVHLGSALKDFEVSNFERFLGPPSKALAPENEIPFDAWLVFVTKDPTEQLVATLHITADFKNGAKGQGLLLQSTRLWVERNFRFKDVSFSRPDTHSNSSSTDKLGLCDFLIESYANLVEMYRGKIPAIAASTLAGSKALTRNDFHSPLDTCPKTSGDCVHKSTLPWYYVKHG